MADHAKPDHPKEHDSYTTSVRMQGSNLRKKRWEDEKGNLIWPASRVFVVKHMEAQYFELSMGFIILVNFLLIIAEVDQEALCYPLPEGSSLKDCPTRAGEVKWLWYANTSLLMIYTVEALMRVFGEHWDFFNSSWNLLDVFIVVTGWMGEVMTAAPSFGFLRFLRTMRLLRMMRILIAFRELYLLITGMLSAFRTLFFSTFMLFAMLIMWSIIMVEHVHPVNIAIEYDGCTRCPAAFESVWASVITLFQQIVAGDSWGQVSIPVIEASPMLGFVLVGIVITVSLGLMNLVLAVIVERAQDAREQDREQKVKDKEAEQDQQKQELMGYCKDMDGDASGEIDLDELLSAYESMESFRGLLTLMDIAADELQSVFKLLDKDGSGSVSYVEFCDELHKIRTRDTRTMLTFLKLSINDCNDSVKASRVGVEQKLEEQGQKIDAQSEYLQAIASRLEKLGNLEGQATAAAGNAADPGSGPAAAAQQRPMPSMRTDVGAGQSVVEALCKDARELVSMKNGLLGRLEAQIETLLQQSDWLFSMGQALPAPDTAKIERVEDRMCRMRENIYETEKGLESIAASIARNSEVLSGLSKEMGYQQKAGQRRPDGATMWRGVSPRLGGQFAPQEWKASGGDVNSRGAPRDDGLRPAAESAWASACATVGTGRTERLVVESDRR